MKLIFTKSGAPLSRFIRWGLNEPVSHVGILFDNKLVFHSNLLGVHPEGIYSFKSHSELVLELELNLTLDQEEAIYQALLVKYDGNPYDYSAFAYFVWRAFLYKTMNTPIPNTNAWQKPTWYICDGLLECLNIPESPEWLKTAIESLGDIEMKSPFKVYQELSKTIK